MPGSDVRALAVRFRVPALGGAATAVALLALGRGALADPPRSAGVPLILAAAEAVLLLAVVPFARRPAAWIVALVLGGTLARALAPGPFAAVDAVVLLGWGGALLGLRVLLRSGVATAAVGALAIASLTWSGPWIEASGDPGLGVALAIRVNPVAAIAYGGHDLDWARLRPVTYGQFVGQYHLFRPPTAGEAAATWIAAGLVGAGIAFAAHRGERRRRGSSAATDGGRGIH